MMQVYIINGPNLNLTGTRQPEIYGNRNINEYISELQKKYPQVELHYYQSNHVGEIIDKIHQISFSCDGIILNPAAYTHTSLALGDAVAAIKKPVVEVHISNIFSRDTIRQHSLISKYAKGVIAGFGIDVYELALITLIKMDENKS